MKKKLRSYALFLLLISLTGCQSCGDEIVKDIVTLSQLKIVEKRIAGGGFIELDRPNGNDNLVSTNGFSCVYHNPGCGISGNSGVDKFFFNKNPLPLFCKLVRVEFTPFWPKGIDPKSGIGGLFGWGTYQSTMKINIDGSVEVDWNNACQGSFAGKDLFYQISFIITMPEGTDMGENVFDVATQVPQCAPSDYTSTPAIMNNPTSLESSGFSGIVKYCNITGSNALGTLHIEGTCTKPLANALGNSTMVEDIPVQFVPSGGGVASQTGFVTKTIYKQGTWNITKVQLVKLTNPLPPIAPLQLPGMLGQPIFDFSFNSCNR